ncbi:MAG: ROK family protein [Candidatus Binatia bacterium]|nr:ROK family protein [Candidatus Binatia bacterium]
MAHVDYDTIGEKAGLRTLAIDIGGTGLKMMVLDASGVPVNERDRERTPSPGTPRAILAVLATQIDRQPQFDRISVGFPGVVIEGIVRTAPNLSPEWHEFPLAEALRKQTGRETRAANDADVQGLGDIEGIGVELVLTLGTGFGSALFMAGTLVPNLELGHHPFRGDRTYEDYVGKPALEDIGKKRWRKRLLKVLTQIQPIWNPRKIYLGGGNAKLVKPEDLPENVKICPNAAGITGGIALWRQTAGPRDQGAHPAKHNP